MSYIFDGTDDQVQWSIGSCSLTGAYTLACVIELDSGVTWQSFLSNEVTASGSEIATGRHGGTGLFCTFIGGGAGGTPNAIGISSSDDWMLVATTRPAGAGQTITQHKVIMSSLAETHTAASGTFSNGLAQNKVVFGQIDGSDFFKGKLAVAAEWNSALSNANILSLASTFTRANWLSLSPVGLWDATDQFATDQTGNGATRTSLTGTTSSADDPTGWASWAGAAATTSIPPVQPYRQTANVYSR